VKKLISLGLGALLHDVGKIFTEDEGHPHAGYNFVKNNSNISTTSYICLLQHHEYEDGSGYPQRLRGDKIYELSKVVGICNEYVNMLHKENSKLPNEVIEKMTAWAVLKYDHGIFRSFVKAIYCFPNGLEVKLNNDKVGIVVRQNKDLPTRPVVAVFEGERPQAIDLTSQSYQTLFIDQVIM
jgi:HD-GYP domain-containing protein (c-di-GMP phosphodiesterase class II)